MLRIFALVLSFMIFAQHENVFAQESAALVKKGGDIAKGHCSRCHVVDEKNRFSGISSTPSFPLLINALADWEERFTNFFIRLPHPSIIRFKGDPVDPDRPVLTVPIELEHSDIEAIIAYVRTLRKSN
jgi:hypothetical protein